MHIAAALAGLVGFKLYALEAVSRDFLQCRWCLSPTAFVHELNFALLVLALHLASNAMRPRWLRWMLRVIVLALLALMAADLAVSYLFWTRLTLADLIKHLPEVGSLFSFARHAKQPQLLWTAVLAIFVTFVGIGLRYLRARLTGQGLNAHLLWVCLGIYGCSTLGRQEDSLPREYHEHFTQNVLEVFFTPALEKLDYSPEFAAHVPPRDPSEQRCLQGQGQRINVVLVVVESLSLFHSQLFSGLNDWTPELDALARGGLRFTEFYANGVTTEQGLIALLTGRPPIERGDTSAKTLFAQYRVPTRSLPHELHQAGYETAFLTTGNLSFLGKGDWLHELGFDDVEGHDTLAYRSLPRYSFDAADDGALYRHAFDVIGQLKTPYFITLETVTTHLPYIDPETGEHSAERVYRYADHALGEFARKLERTGFFKNGLLVVTGDHRAMVPMTRSERHQYGDYGYARVPLIIVGRGIRKGRLVESRFSQTDLLPSLVQLTTDQVQCLSPDEGVLWPNALRQARCTYTRRSYDPSQIYARCENSDVTVQLEADRTRVVAGQDDNEVLATIHRLRLARGY